MEIAPIVTAVVWLAAGLLIVAGAAKLRNPDEAMALLHRLRLPSGRLAARAFGLGEIVVGLAVLLFGGRVLGALLAAVYLGFAAVAESQRRRQQSCGCFGASDVATTGLQVGVDIGLGLAAAAGAVWWTPSALPDLAAADGPLLTAVALLLAAAAVGALRTLLVSHGRAVHAATLRRRPSTRTAATT